jgi:hypothetical protein
VRKRVSGYNGSMGFFQIDPNVERLLPADTRLINLRAVPSSDGKRLKIGLDMTPFQQKPYLDLILTGPSGDTLATTSIVEPVGWNLELNLHIRKSPSNLSGKCKLTVVISYPDLGEVDRRDLTIEIPTNTE